MKQLPEIIVSAGFWASIATLWSAAGAWFTFFGTVRATRADSHNGLLNFLAGIEAELALVSQWASGNEGDPGYSRSDDFAALAKKYPAWFNPSRQIFSFDTPNLNGFTNSQYVTHLAPLVPDFVRLNHSIRKLFDYVHLYQTFVYGEPELYSEVFAAVSNGMQPKTERGLLYANVVFGMNVKIHIDLIGGADSPDEDCLYKSFRRAKKTLSLFKSDLQPTPFPLWYWILHGIAGFLALNGIWQVARWLQGVCG